MSKRKLLLADDSITIQKVVNLTFADEGIEVVTVGDGDSALQKINESRPDLVLADVHMPGLSGYEVCERIRANDDTRDLPVLLLVGSFEPFDEAEAERVGANGFMTKPFQSIRQLVSKVSELIETSPGASAAEAANGNAAAPAYAPESDEPRPAEAGGFDTETPHAEAGFDATSDIEDLYKESVGETTEAETSPELPAGYVDAGMDDEMIEARYSGDSEIGGQPEFAAGGAAESAAAQEQVFEPQPDLQERSIAAAEAQRESSFDHFAETERMDPGIFENEQRSEPQYESRAADLDRPPAGYQDAPDRAGSEPSEVFEFDDSNLLELPPVGQAEPVQIVAPQEATAQGGAKQLVTLSPELLDMIVQRVIERLSERK